MIMANWPFQVPAAMITDDHPARKRTGIVRDHECGAVRSMNRRAAGMPGTRIIVAGWTGARHPGRESGVRASTAPGPPSGPPVSAPLLGPPPGGPRASLRGPRRAQRSPRRTGSRAPPGTAARSMHDLPRGVVPEAHTACVVPGAHTAGVVPGAREAGVVPAAREACPVRRSARRLRRSHNEPRSPANSRRTRAQNASRSHSRASW